MILLQLFFEFFKTGLFAVGGGLATLPFLEDISRRTGGKVIFVEGGRILEEISN